MSDYRSVIGYAKEPMQQSMMHYAQDNSHLLHNRMELGIVLNVYPADHADNRSAIISDVQRGFRHECDVQIVSAGHGGPYVVRHVPITPNMPSGVDNYEEHLPRPCSTKIGSEGGEFDQTMQNNDPYELDGDWCIVGFLNNNIGQPFILRWWPNPNNTYDPATSGDGNPGSTGQGTTLNQFGRVFKRINGIEQIITPEGDIYLDTTYADADIDFEAPSERGRIKRTPSPDSGGNIRVVIKESAAVELDWNLPKDGVGLQDEPNPYLPQANPSERSSSSSTPSEDNRANTFITLDKDVLKLECPRQIEFKAEIVRAVASSEVYISAPETTINSGDVRIGDDGAAVDILGSGIIIGDETAVFALKTDAGEGGYEGLQSAVTAAPASATSLPDTVAAHTALLELIQEWVASIARATNVSIT